MKAIRCKKIYTVASDALIDGYLLIDGNRIRDIIPAEEWHANLADEILDYEDGFLMPGFNDYHVHIAMAAMMEYFGTIRRTATEEEAAKYLYEHNKDKDPDQWILGGAWDHFVWPGQKLPSKESLDRYFPHTPVFSLNKECHGAWLNSEALRRLHITKDTPNPPNGEYFKDENGELTGYVHELAVAPLLRIIFEEISDERIADFTRAFAKMANRLGITSVGDLPLHGILREGAYRILQKAGDSSIRINFSVAMMESNEKIKAMEKEFTGPVVTFNGVKDFLDGTPMGYTGYLAAPYEDRPGFVSEPLIPRDKLLKRITELDALGVKCRLHCCGDGAVHLALDAFEEAGKVNGFRDLRHAIEHIEMIVPEDIPRFKELGVIASVQPEHSPRTHYSTHPFHHLIGEERMKYMWAFKSISDTGAHMAFGTDYPVVDFTPFKGLFRCVNRLTNELEPEGGYNPWEKLSLREALRNYTYGSAYACGREKELGTLEAGKLADITVLGKDPFEIIGDRDQMFEMPVLMTMMDGNIVYEA
ncbi:amidohydrolase [Anaerovorax odorimutans]|uniref:Amidohydrolase n=1 Tax=Anaerovorax odorimutans TaxID=109327 RepID=A0ABT1RMP9_9FIRM|nr:amidohydrolase [Anaerovorax odorimutans]MCQ4636458.1 amidohydrolase [Anaerovorax odorimutans]